MLSCVVNIASGSDPAVIAAIGEHAGRGLLDVHRDVWHDRSVLTVIGEDIVGVALEIARAAVQLIDIDTNAGVHPHLGAIDVVPFVPLGDEGFADDADLRGAIAARDSFSRRAAADLALPCFRYGPERSLPEVRRTAFRSLAPDDGPSRPRPGAGACCVGARPCLVAYNIYLAKPDLDLARGIARRMRSAEIRALGLRVGDEVQVSCNLVAPWRVGPADAVDVVARTAAIARTELVGLVPAALLRATDRARWRALDLSEDRTIEARRAVAER